MTTSTKPLTGKQRRFVDAYMGSCEGHGVRAARLAGYLGDEDTLAVTASRLIRSAKISKEIEQLQASSPLVATRDERLQVLTSMMRDSTLSPKDRQRAIELLGKTFGDYIQRVELSGPDGSAIQSESRIDLSSLSLDDLKGIKGV